ncbi:long-chain fatty acid--CoA ligase [Mangrovimicrobium sediminis]|uniref:Long-chain fatty acid--CoA ligase n=1 Tax=Mangrovimicrobium sediminis TaxID=2562682 RepID=A0A4Z0M376_9GAMM|nr:fatty acid--CoA ligase family protein [Haliea sp. SAOS-164]TGD74143.1 long-chain fatty acid--CoA ligase [Haliea sp. SAOS-164]
MTTKLHLRREDLLASRTVISDANSQLALSDCAQLFAALDELTAESGIGEDQAVALACDNDVASAVTLLYLLARGQGVYLAHPVADDTPDSDALAALPAFCSHLLLPAAGIDADARPARMLATGNDSTGSQCAGRLYAATSGSTGTPRIAVHSHPLLWRNAQNCRERLQLAETDCIAIPVPLFHMYGLGAAFLPAVLAGANVALIGDTNVLRYLQREAASKPSVAYLTPSFAHSLLRVRKSPRQYRLTVLAGDRAPASTFDAYEQKHGCVVCLYGSTELGAIAAGSPDDPAATRRETSGRLMPGVELAAAGEDSPAVLGFRHASGCAGYADAAGRAQPGELLLDGVYRTSDLGELDAAGYLRIHGRRDHTVNRDGQLVSFSAVEQALSQLDAIVAAVVCSNGETPRGAQLTAVCVAADKALDAREIRQQVRSVLAHYAIPDTFLWWDALPRLPSGKPDRQAIQTQLAQADAPASLDRTTTSTAASAAHD